MKKITFILILITALWNALPDGSPLRPLFDLVAENPDGGVIATSDPETDPNMINTPPPRP